MPSKIDMSKRLIASFLEEKDTSKTENKKTENKKIENTDFSTLNNKEFINLYNNYKKSLNNLKSLKNLIQNKEYDKHDIINKINNKFRPIINILREQNYENIYIEIENHSDKRIFLHITQTRVIVCDIFDDEIEMDKLFWMNIYNNIDNYLNEFIEKLSSLFTDEMDKCNNEINIISNYLENIKQNNI